MDAVSSKGLCDEEGPVDIPRRPLPAFKDLPLKPEYPPHAAWGVWGDKDELGTVNNITPETILAASKEIKQGLSIPLNWPLDQPKYQHAVIVPMLFYVNWFQWFSRDSLRHFGYQAERVFYNGLKQDDLLADKNLTQNGIHNWARTGIVGRGVLLDFYGYALRHNIAYDPYSRYGITHEQLEAVRAEQGVEFHVGDILLIRFGHIAVYNSFPDDRKKEAAKFPYRWAGVGQSKNILEWIWDNHFSAVGGDSPAFETTPPLTGSMIHSIILSGFGCPIGELFDLERLAVECEASKRWSFFFTSVPLNIPGGVASPSNAIAIM
ncbi:hypothetical protein FRC10_000120 [Ceratobasidium sp. 414]|nr:hypothetical protein FRC10_000120 [Ceratobasidium sp. 414]